MNRFFAIDVETANSSRASICQIGLVEFKDGEETGANSWLVDPDEYFDAFNIALHGIGPDAVSGKLKFAEIVPEISRLAGDAPIISHSSFDRVAIWQACKRAALDQFGGRWLDSARIARRAWPEIADKGYGLKNLARRLDIDFKHHDALEDARTAGLIAIAAFRDTGIDLEGWFESANKPAADDQGRKPRLDGHEGGPLSGERVVFTGELAMVRREAAAAAQQLGAAVEPSVTKKTTMLIVGTQNPAVLAGKDKSGSHRKAESLIAKGSAIQILFEGDWQILCELLHDRDLEFRAEA